MLTFARKAKMTMLPFPKIIYVYDAHCGWCFGFKNVMKQLHERFHQQFRFEVLSGNMLPLENKQHIGKIAPYIAGAYKRVEELSGCTFGEGYLKHIFHPEESTLELCSEKPGIALSIFKTMLREDDFKFAAALQDKLMVEGKDLEKDEVYLELANEFEIDGPNFVARMQTEDARDIAHSEFAMVKQLGISGFPCVLVQLDERKLYMIARGYTQYEELETRLNKVLEEFRVANN